MANVQTVPGREVQPVKRVLAGFAILALGGAVLVSWLLLKPSSPGSASASIPSIHAEGFNRQTIYRSPQTPGHTAWVGAWIMPDQGLMTGFVQATGNVDPNKRTLAPRSVLEAFGQTERDPTRDFWGLKLAVKYLRSTDGGKTWRPFRSDRFKAFYPHGFSPQASIALKDGTLLRRVNGDDLRFDRSIPHTAYLERLAPNGTDWRGKQVLMDPNRYTYQLTRIRYLRDGRLVATGVYWKVPASTRPSERSKVPSAFLLMVSSDDGTTWKNGMTDRSGVDYLPGGEWDTAELPNGDLAGVMRTLSAPSNPQEVRKQALLKQRGGGWVMTDVKTAPFPHSGHPELLTTREGPILHIATTGIHYTKDGRTWRPLEYTPKVAYKSNYYPRAVQTRDGVVHVFAHVGADDPYGQTSQSITVDDFRIATDATP